MLYRILLCLTLLVSVIASAQAAAPVAGASASLKLVVSVRPLDLLTRELTQGLTLQVQTLLPPGATPHDYALKPSDLKAIAAADLVVWLGATGEPYLSKVASRGAQAIAWEAQPGLLRLPLREALHAYGEEHEDDHEAEHEHDHHSAGFDPHFWLSVDNALLLADQLAVQLSALLPDQAAVIARNRASLAERLQQQRTQTAALLAATPAPFLLSHDAYHYLEEDLGVHSVGAISLDPEIKPGVKHLMAIKNLITERGIRCVITDPSVSSALLDKVEAKPALSRIAIDPMAWDYQGNLYSEWLSSLYVKMVVCISAP